MPPDARAHQLPRRRCVVRAVSAGAAVTTEARSAPSQRFPSTFAVAAVQVPAAPCSAGPVFPFAFNTEKRLHGFCASGTQQLARCARSVVSTVCGRLKVELTSHSTATCRITSVPITLSARRIDLRYVRVSEPRVVSPALKSRRGHRHRCGSLAAVPRPCSPTGEGG